MGLDNPLHIAFLLILLLLVFGAKRLPEMGRSLGSGMRGFKDSLSGEHTHEPHESVAAIPAQAPAAPAVSNAASTAQSESAVAARAVGERVPVA
jgi:sec-independent protein translocase protein TatA